MTEVATGPGWELRLGPYQEALTDVSQAHAIITDPPYSERTVKGHRHGTVGHVGGPRAVIGYHWFSEEQTRELASWCAERAHGFVAQWGDHVQFYWVEDEWRRAGLFTFAPVPWVKSCGGTPRFTADGPAASVEWCAVARTRTFPDRRYRQGHYILPGRRSGDGGIAGAKTVDLMRAVVRDYSQPGGLVVDPCAGGATTLIAAVLEGRRALGSEKSPENFAKAAARLDRETRDRVYIDRPGAPPKMRQPGLFDRLEAAE